VKGIKCIPYEQRLRRLSLTTLEYRWTRGDLNETNNVLTGKEDINELVFFERYIGARYMQGHSHKLQAERSRLEISRHLFSIWVVKGWNSLPSDVVEMHSVDAFKNKLDMLKKEERDI
jgi:hypothetical protein